MTSIANPILYTWLNESFKEAFIGTLVGKWVSGKSRRTRDARRNARHNARANNNHNSNNNNLLRPGDNNPRPVSRQSCEEDPLTTEVVASNLNSPADGMMSNNDEHGNGKIRCDTPLPESTKSRKKKQQMLMADGESNENLATAETELIGPKQSKHETAL